MTFFWKAYKDGREKETELRIAQFAEKAMIYSILMERATGAAAVPANLPRSGDARARAKFHIVARVIEEYLTFVFGASDVREYEPELWGAAFLSLLERGNDPKDPEAAILLEQ